MNDPIVIVSAARTALGTFQGGFAGLSAANLGAVAIKAAVERAGIEADLVDEVLMGCVLPAGQGQAPVRQAALLAGLPLSAGCAMISKVCGSGMKATMLGHDGLLAGSSNITVVGGMESMTNAPYLLPKARGGYRLGHGQIIDHMFMDGLEDAYSKETRGRLMGTFAEDCASSYSFTREQQDEFAIRSTTRAKQASDNGSFAWEIAATTVAGRRVRSSSTRMKARSRSTSKRSRRLKPAFKKDGTVTPANSSSISDGAAAMVLMRASQAAKLGLSPLAGIVGHQNTRPHPGPVPDRAGRRDAEITGKNRVDRSRRRSVGNQRSLCRGDDGRHPRHAVAGRESEYPRRRLCAGPPDRRFRGADRRHAARRAEENTA